MHSVRLLLTAATFIFSIHSRESQTLHVPFDVNRFACSLQTLIESRDPDEVEGVYRFFAQKLSCWTGESQDSALATLIDPHVCRITERFR